MIFQAYNEADVRNLQLRDVADELLENGQLTPPQYQQVETAFPIAFKQSNVFVRLGLFLFTSLCILFSTAFLGWIIVGIGSHEDNLGILCLILALCLTAINEFFIRDRHWYRQGSDNALCYASIICFIVGFGIAFKIEAESSKALLCLIFLALGAIRYGDPLLALGSFYALMMSLLYVFAEKELSYVALPFVCAGVALGIYFMVNYLSKKENLFYWEDCFTILKIVSLAGFYVSINYWWVAQWLERNPLNYATNDIGENLENDIQNSFPPFLSLIFAALTALVPLAYVFLGIKNKDRILWVMGGLGIAASVLTYRHYHSIMPIEWALTLAGIAFLALAYLLMTYLKTPRSGFVYLPKQNKNGLIEALVINQVLQQTAAGAPDDSVKYGGGDFGGGGASGDF